MATLSVQEAETQLAALIDRAAKGEEVIIAKEGTPPMRLQPLPASRSRLGFLKDKGYLVPDDFNEMGRDEMERTIYGEP